MVQDAKGFLWVGTQDGLFRFDSKNNKQFNKNQSPESAIGGTDIRDLAGSSNGIWVTSTQGGVDKIDLATSYPSVHLPQSRFPGLANNTITSLVDLDTMLFVGSEKGLYRYVPFRNEISKIRFNGNYDSLYIDKLTFYKNYLLIFFRNQGCITYNVLTHKITSALKTTDNATYQTHRFYSLAKYSGNQWLLGTSHGINLATITDNGQLTFDKKPFAPATELFNSDIYAIAVDKDKNIWFSTDNDLVKLNPFTKEYFQIADALANDVEFLNNVYRIYCDKENNIWLGCQTGLFYLTNKPSPTSIFHHFNHNASKISHAYYLFPANDSIVMVTAENGLYEVNIHAATIKEIDNSQAYDFIFHDPYNRLLVSNKSGLHQLKRKSLVPISNIYPEFKPYADYTINSAIRTNASEIVMGTENNRGILIWDYAGHTIKNITTSSGALTLDNNIINGVFPIKEDMFCVITESSLILIDKKMNTSRKVHLLKDSTGQEYGLFFDMCRVKDSYYLSSYGNGVLVMDTAFTVQKIISTANGLSNNSVYKFLPWKDSLLFMTSNSGLNILNVQTGKVKQFFKSDGLHDDVFEETSGNIFKNMIYAGGRNGFTVIYPEHLHPNEFPPQLYITRISTVLPGGASDTSNTEATHFEIPSNAIQTNIWFSGINYSNPHRTTFAYKIAEIHKDWVHLDTRNLVTLIGLSPGAYHLQVQAFNEDGIKSGIKELTLVFLPKWYQTRWFSLAIILLIAGIIYSLYRLRINQLKKEQQIRSKLAGDLHDDLGSTMNSIKVYANLALLEKKEEKYLFKIRESTQEAITGIRDMIWVLDDSKGSMEDLFARVAAFAAPLCEANGMQFKQVLSDEARDHKLAQAEKRNLYMMLKEAINNAIKYSGGETITIEGFIKKGQAQILVKDDGKGFDPMQQTTGNGLKNMAWRAKEIKYSLEIDSYPGTTTIHLQKI